MSDQQHIEEEIPRSQDEILDEHFSFKTTSFVRHDTLLSIIYFCALLALPHLIWPDTDRNTLLTWQIVMLGITACRWIGRAFFNHVETDRHAGFISTAMMLLALLDGLGWGLAGVLFLPSSASGIYLTGVLLLGMAGIGAAAYSSRMLVAVPYLFCVTSPFVLHILQMQGDEYLILAGVIALLCIVFCFVIDKINITLEDALSSQSDKREEHALLRSDLRRMKSRLMELDNQRIRAQRRIKEHQAEMDELQTVMITYDDELDKLESLSVNLRDELNLLDTNQPEEQLTLNINRLREQVEQLVDTLQSDEPVALLEYTANPALPAPETSDENTRVNSVNSDQSQASPDSATLNRIKPSSILIVNTDPQEIQKIEGLCRKGDHHYVSVSSVPEALSTLCDFTAEDTQLDLIICQRELPDMDGPGFANCLQDDQEYNAIPFVMITHSNQLTQEQQLADAEIQNILAVIHRPLNIDELEQAMEHALSTEVIPPPHDLSATLNDSHEISQDTLPNESNSNVDHYVLDGLRVTASSRFEEIVNSYLEEGPELIKQALSACKGNDLNLLLTSVKELSVRSLHMGALGLMERCSELENMIKNDSTPERVIGMLHFLEADFIEVESTLLAELTKNNTLGNSYISNQDVRRDS